MQMDVSAGMDWQAEQLHALRRLLKVQMKVSSFSGRVWKLSLSPCAARCGRCWCNCLFTLCVTKTILMNLNTWHFHVGTVAKCILNAFSASHSFPTSWTKASWHTAEISTAWSAFHWDHWEWSFNSRGSLFLVRNIVVTHLHLLEMCWGVKQN